MTNRERFRETMRHGTPDRLPCFDEGMRDETLAAWRAQGLPADADLHQLFGWGPRDEVVPDLDPHPKPECWPTTTAGLDAVRRRLDPADPTRLPKDWPERVRAWQIGDQVRMLRVHRGFFLSMGVHDWQRFAEVMCLAMDAPGFVRDLLRLQGEFAAALADRILSETPIDAAILSEPIGGNDRPLLSPRMYEDLVLPSYQPVLDVLARHRVETIILRTYGDTRALLPAVLARGVNCLWVSEANTRAMDYRSLRRQFGRDLRLIGGIDLNALRRDRPAIRRELQRRLPPLLADGGYIPLAGGRIREDVPFANYVYYRQRLLAALAGRR